MLDIVLDLENIAVLVNNPKSLNYIKLTSLWEQRRKIMDSGQYYAKN